MKKNLRILAFTLFCLPILAVAQVKTNFNSKTVLTERGHFSKPYKIKIDHEIAAKNISDLVDIENRERALSKQEKPFQIATPVSVDLNIAKLTSWYTEGDTAFGKFTIKLNGALSSSINFDQFYLPKGTEMYIYNENGNMITGPVTENENNPNKVWGSWIYQGPFLTIELKTPSATLSQLILHSNNIAYGYKEVYTSKVIGFGSSGTCEINVICPLGTGWESERNSVALILSASGSALCSGSMIMNTCNSNRPFFLTANHCYATSPVQDVTQWRFTFQAWSATCNPSQNSDGVTYNGSILRANWSNSDFCLVELNNTPPSNSGINYAGWTTNATPAQNGTGIHHPQGDVMKISRANNTLTRTAFGGGPGTDHWQVNWSPQDNGAGQIVTAVTEPGSSGSPLFDQNHRIVGQLHGGPSSCGGTNLWDFYGSFDVSWAGGGTNNTRLSNWLDPNITGVMTTNTTNIASLTNYTLSLSISGNSSFCSGSSVYTLSGVPAGATVTWSISNSNIATITPNGNSVTVSQAGNGDVTLTATVNSQCYANNVANKTISIGVPDYTSLTIWSSANSVCPNISMPFVATYANRCNLLGAEWQTTPSDATVTPNSGFPCINDNNTGVTISFPNYGTYTVTTRVQNACGWSNWAQIPKTIQVACGTFASFTISPNPTNSIATVAPKNNSKATFTSIKVYDNFGNLKKEMKYGPGTSQAKINVDDLNNGVYVVEVTSNLNKESHQLIIQK